MEAYLHDVNKIVVGKIKERESFGKKFYVRNLVVASHRGEEIKVTLFADKRKDLAVLWEELGAE